MEYKFVELLEKILLQLHTTNRRLEMIMGTGQTGLAALQAFSTAFQSFATQQTADLAALTATIGAAIAALQNSSASEDVAVQAAVTQLQSALDTVSANETALETLNTSLGAATQPKP